MGGLTWSSFKKFSTEILVGVMVALITAAVLFGVSVDADQVRQDGEVATLKACHEKDVSRLQGDLGNEIRRLNDLLLQQGEYQKTDRERLYQELQKCHQKLDELAREIRFARTGAP